MSIRQFLYLSISIILIMLMVLIYTGYQQSARTISHLRTFSEDHDSALNKIEYSITQMMIADHNFELMIIPPEIIPSEIEVLGERLLRLAQTTSLSPAHMKILESPTQQLHEALGEFLQSSDPVEWPPLIFKVGQNIDLLEKQIIQIYRQLSTQNSNAIALPALRNSRNLLTELAIHVEEYGKQSLFDSQRVIVPLEIAHSEIEEILGIVASLQLNPGNLDTHDHNDPNIEHSQHSTDVNPVETLSISQLEALSSNITRLISAVNLHIAALHNYDQTATYQSRSTELITGIQKLVRAQLDQIRNNLKTHISASQQTLINSSLANQQLFLVLSIFSIIISLIVALYLSGVITGSIKALQEGAREFSSGNLDFRIGKLKTREFAEVSGVFNQMAASLEDDQIKLRKLVQKLYEVNRDLDVRVVARTRELESAMQEAVEANQAKSLFLSNMSHELRTPMHAILSFSELGVAKVEAADKKSMLLYFNRIHEGGQRLLSLIGDLLDLSKLESGKMEFSFARHDMIEVIEAASSELESLLKDKGIHLDCNSTTNTKFDFDRDKIHQVLINLLSNAIKFSPPDSKIDVVCSQSTLRGGQRIDDPDDTPALEVAIGDQGVGIPQDQLEDIFGMFIQSSNNSADGSGTGLGLAICRQIIDGHSGTIKSQNRPQGGAEFIFTLPLHPTILHH